MAESIGFFIAGSGYWDSLLFPVIVLYRKTIARKATESDAHAFPQVQNRLLYRTTTVERALAGYGVHLPFGTSVWLEAVKP